MNKAVFLDRDGTIIEDRGNLRDHSQVVFLPEAVDALRRLQDEFLLFIVTNQPGVAEGAISSRDVDNVNAHVVAELGKAGVRITNVYVCPHAREDGCSCIKPRPHFLREAATRYRVDLRRSFTIGDHPHDVELARAVRGRGIYVLTGHGEKHLAELPSDATVTRHIGQAAERILTMTHRQSEAAKAGERLCRPGRRSRAAGTSATCGDHPLSETDVSDRARRPTPETNQRPGAQDIGKHNAKGNPMKYLIMLAAVIIQVCLGGVYAFSALVPALKETVNLTTAQTQVIFGGIFGAFTVSMVLAGKLLDRLGPRVIALAGGLLFGGGYLLASYSGGSYPVMILGISVLAGIGTGAGYVCPLTTGMKWFPDHRGLITGIAMAGFGGGAVLLSALVDYLLSHGVHVLMVFRWIGLAYGVALLAAAALLRFPPTGKTARVRPAPPARFLLRDPFFLSLVIGMFCGTFAGMLVIGNLKPMALAVGIPDLMATAAISVFAIGNAAGRITWGWACDRTDERMIPVKLAALAVPLVLLAWVHSAALFVAVSFAIGFGFGACFVVYAAQVASRYGLARVGGVYPLVFLSYGLAGIVGPPLGGWLYDSTSSYTPAIALSCGVVGAGFVGSILLLRKARTSRLECFAN